MAGLSCPFGRKAPGFIFMKVLITGGAGFIGSHLADRLILDGHTVRLFDNLSTGKRANLTGPAAAAELLVGDVRDLQAIRASARGMNAIVHLAAIASVQASIEDPLGTHATNLNGTLHCLDAAQKAGVERVLYASSAAVYGDRAAPPVPEHALPDPLSPYAVDKLGGEYYLSYYARTHGLDTTAFRFFNIYGPRQDASSPYSGVISLFAERLARGLPFPIFGDGRQTRDFVYIEDLIEILAQALIRHDLTDTVMNIGTGIEQELLTLVAAFETLSGSQIKREFEAARVGDIRRSCADVTRLREALGLVPQTSLLRGLSQVLELTVPEPCAAP